MRQTASFPALSRRPCDGIFNGVFTTNFLLVYQWKHFEKSGEIGKITCKSIEYTPPNPVHETETCTRPELITVYSCERNYSPVSK